MAAAFAGLGMRSLGMPVLLGYIMVGSMIGPSMLGYIESLVQVETMAQL